MIEREFTPTMPLRDWFAGMALQSLVCLHDEEGKWRGVCPEEAATLSYEIANAMMAERLL